MLSEDRAKLKSTNIMVRDKVPIPLYWPFQWLRRARIDGYNSYDYDDCHGDRLC